MLSKSGADLLDEDGVRMMRSELLRWAEVVTPNLPEAEVLSGRRITSIEDARAAAYEIHQLGGSAVVITGGHAPGNAIVDLLYDGSAFTELLVMRIDTPNTHGTGCTFASAIAAYLARGSSLLDAVVDAQQYVRGAIEHSFRIGHGHGPLNHFWRRR
jgi:hydroxymethylpyrimidine/phosphomethylpyrimidine kinase